MTIELGLQLAERVGSMDSLTRPETLRAAKAGVVDYLASTMMGRREPEIEKVLAWARAQGVCNGGTPALGHPDRFAPAQLAFVNAMQAHVLDIDDVHPAVRGHPSAVVLSALFAVVTEDSDGADFLSAYVAGVEVMATFGRLLNPGHYQRGWHSTATIGALGAAAAVARFRQLDTRSIAMAMSLASSQSCGMRLQFGTTAKPLQAAMAARTGVTSVEWVIAGLTANPDFLETKLGYLALHEVATDAEHLFSSWHEPWAITDPGLWFKRYPFCGAAMSGAEAAEILVTDPRYRRDDVVAVEAAFPDGADAALVYRHPGTGEQGRFSIEYIVACVLDGLPLTIESFSRTPIAPERTRTMGLVRRTTMSSDPARPPQPDTRPTTLTITLKDGTLLTSTITTPLGSAARPLNADQRKQKLEGSLIDPLLVVPLIDAVENLGGDSMKPLLDLLATIH